MSFVKHLEGNSKEKTQSLEGKTVLVTGSTRGIGLAVATEMLARGANVMFHGTPKPDGKPPAEFREEFESLQSKYPMQKLAYRQCDVTDPEQVHSLIEETAKFGDGKIDVLVNNAGIQIQKPIEALSNDEFDKVMKTHMYGTFYTTKEAMPYMSRKNDQGLTQIINMSSVHGLVPSPERPAYCAAKHAVQGFTGVSAAELARYNIRVNSINPAFVETDLAWKPIRDRAEKLVAQHGMSEDEALNDSLDWRLKHQGGSWVKMDQVVKDTCDLADFTNRCPTGVAIIQDRGKDIAPGEKGYIDNARAAPAGAAIFEHTDRVAIKQLDARVAALSGHAQSA